MLRTRLLAAAVLLPAAIAWALWAPLMVYAGVAALFVLIGAWEWSGLAGLRLPVVRIIYLLLALVLMALGWLALSDNVIAGDLLWAFLLFWLLAALELARGPLSASRRGLAAQGFLVLVPAWFAMVAIRLRPEGAELVLALLLIVWAADAGAYFAGKAWGLRRIAPALSPGKTWEGFAGGLAAAALAGAVTSLWCPVSPVVLIPLALTVTVFSLIGDLAESRLKRSAGAKDSGRLIPGHGGLLDRIDSLTAAAPVFALGLGLVGAAR
ncbi:MAG: phosphatidate cytidylyltransferase [Gammaproteobacteria bacterium]